ncbi:cupin domain-containing protein [Gramella sp. BOM4]|nr:cupin domain-containing protein [Christiangramia bathymodioli]
MNSQEQSVAINILDGDLEWADCPEFIPNGCNVSILHGDPTQGNTDAIFKFEPNTDIPEHWHTSAERMILLDGELDVTYEGEATKTLTKGYYAYGPAKKPHTARCNDSGPCYLFVAFVKPVDAFPGKSD